MEADSGRAVDERVPGGHFLSVLDRNPGQKSEVAMKRAVTSSSSLLLSILVLSDTKVYEL